MPGHSHQHTHDDDPAAGTLPELLDLDGVVLEPYWADAFDRLRRIAGPGARRVVDLGAGTGTGTVGLARVFPDAEIVAVDASELMSDRLLAKVQSLGLAARVRTVVADLDAGWPDLGPIDITWASASLHHLADPDRVLAQVHAATGPGGVLAVAEFDEPLRMLPDDLGRGRPGLEQRCLDSLAAEHHQALPHLGSDWAARLRAAGFTSVQDRPYAIDVPVSSPSARRYARLWLQRLHSGTADRLDDEDNAVLTALLGHGELERRDDLRIRGTRTVTLAHRT